MSTSCSSRYYGLLPSGQTIKAWTLRGSGGLTLECLTYGGIVSRLLAPDREGELADVVLGFNDLESYVARHPHFGAITGRVAGRLTNGRFHLEGKDYQFVLNDPPNHLHGGIESFYRKIWRATPLDRADGAPSLRLTYTSPDGEEGYPGTIDVTVVYTVLPDNTFLIETEGVTDKPTPFNLTHHSYFNLAGEGADSIDDHVVQIHADEAVATDETMTLLGKRIPVAGQPNDFNQPRQLGDVIPHLHKRHGDFYLVRRKNSGLVLAARVTEPTSRRVLEVSTTEQYLQFYTGVSLDGTFSGKSGKTYTSHAGFCLEGEGYSDGANCPEMGDIILRPGKPSRHTTAYTFSTY
jgi:aldose 1-epimerase